jgi:hypothetical protein
MKIPFDVMCVAFGLGFLAYVFNTGLLIRATWCHLLFLVWGSFLKKARCQLHAYALIVGA